MGKNFERLVQFRKEYGHCNASREWTSRHPLARWIARQKQKMEDNSLEEDQRQRLLDIGILLKDPPNPTIHPANPSMERGSFTGGGASSSSSSSSAAATTTAAYEMSKRRARWEEKFKLLQAYHDEHGHCQISCSVGKPEYKGLRDWLKRQRQKLQDTDDTTMSTHQRQCLAKLLGIKNVAKGSRNSKSQSTTRNDNDNDKPNEALQKDSSKTVGTDRRWEENYELLLQYNKEFGHCRVPSRPDPDFPAKYKPLVHWVMLQRHSLYNTGGANLTEDQKQRLFDLGFMTDRVLFREKVYEENFQKMYAEAKAYKEKHGHLNLSTKTELGLWLSRQRSKYNTLKAGKRNNFKMKHYVALSNLGFQFENGIKRKNLAVMVREYVDFVKTHGRFPKCMSRDEDEVRLHHAAYKWKAKRKRCEEEEEDDDDEENNKDGNNNNLGLPPELIADLDSVGFQWTIHARTDKGRRKAIPFDIQFENVKEYMKNNRGMTPSEKHSEYGVFVKEQRKQYALMMKGLKSSMTLDRFRKLSEIGFQFTTTTTTTDPSRGKQGQVDNENSESDSSLDEEEGGASDGDDYRRYRNNGTLCGNTGGRGNGSSLYGYY